MNRASWDDVWLRVCDAIAMRSKCFRRQIGAAVVSARQELVAIGFNGAPPGFPEHGSNCRSWCERAVDGTFVVQSYTNCPAVHAEMNAIVRAGADFTRTRTLYISSSMCIDCAKVAPSAGIARVVMRIDAERDYHRNPQNVAAFLERCGIAVVDASDLISS